MHITPYQKQTQYDINHFLPFFGSFRITSQSKVGYTGSRSIKYTPMNSRVRAPLSRVPSSTRAHTRRRGDALVTHCDSGFCSNMVNAMATLKASLTSPMDVDLASESRGVEMVKGKSDANEPALQRLFVHRGRLLSLMAAAYLLFFLDNCWSIVNEFKSYDAIVRCPNIPEPDFFTKEYDSGVAHTYYTGWWESCGSTEARTQHRLLGEGVRAPGSWCLLSFGKSESFSLVPFSNVARSNITNMTTFHAQNLDKVTADDAKNVAVILRANPSIDAAFANAWYDYYVQQAVDIAFPAWRASYQVDNTFQPTCTNETTPMFQAASFNETWDPNQKYDIRCWTLVDEEDETDRTDFWYYWPQGDTNDKDKFTDFEYFYAYAWEKVVFVTATDNEGAHGMCGPYPALSRSCCTSDQVVTSTKNPPELLRVRKAIAIIKICMNASSAIAAIVAAYKWTDIVSSRKLATTAWLLPFVVSCVLAMLPLATLANLKSAQAYDDSLIKAMDDVDVDGMIKAMRLLMPSQSTYLIDTMKMFYYNNRQTGRDVSELALEIEFRLKTMTGTLIPLALSALALPGAITKASIHVKEIFPSSAWIGWLIRLMPIFYLPWAAAIFCSLSQIFSGPFVTCAVASFLLMKVIDVGHNPRAHTASYGSFQDYRSARRPSKLMFVLLKTLLLASVVFIIVALSTDKYLKRIGIKALIGETQDLGPATVHFIVNFLIGFVAKSSNSIVMFTDVLLIMVAFVARAPLSVEDERIATALSYALQTSVDSAPAAST